MTVGSGTSVPTPPALLIASAPPIKKEPQEWLRLFYCRHPEKCHRPDANSSNLVQRNIPVGLLADTGTDFLGSIAKIRAALSYRMDVLPDVFGV
jgi:hypothetical protein